MHIICQVSAQSWRVEINRFHSTFESFWGRGWCYANVSFCILTQTFRIKTGLHIQRIYTRTFNISENDARPLLISYNNFIPVFYYFCNLKFFLQYFLKQRLPLLSIQNNICRAMASVVTNPNKLKLVELNRTKYFNNRKLVNNVSKIFKFCQHNGQACIKEPALTLAASIGWGSLELETKKLESVDILESWWYAWCCYFCWSPHWLLPLTRTVGKRWLS